MHHALAASLAGRKWWLGSALLAVLLCAAGLENTFSQEAPLQDSSPSSPSSRVQPSPEASPQATDTIVTPKTHSPRKALFLSAAIPGGGQFYNKKYWKIPIIYAGFAGLGYATAINHREYLTFRDELRKRLDGKPGDPDLDIFSNANLIDIKNYYRRNRDLSIIAGAGLYLIQIIEAYVDAHLTTFDVSDDLTLNVRPYLETMTNGSNFADIRGGGGRRTGLTLSFSF